MSKPTNGSTMNLTGRSQRSWYCPSKQIAAAEQLRDRLRSDPREDGFHEGRAGFHALKPQQIDDDAHHRKRLR